MDIHDLALDGLARPIFVNTRFSCLATVSERDSFSPVWWPPHIAALLPEDRCHLNGLALQNGCPRYVTCAALTDQNEGWRAERRDGGCVLEVPSGRVAVRGLSMPHSPRIHDNQLWLLNSGAGELGTVDLERGEFRPMAFLPGYLRGLAFDGDCAIVGLSKPRHKTFSGLLLDDRLSERQCSALCGLAVVHTISGEVVHWVRIEGSVTELYDVVVLPGVARPMAFGFKTDEIQRQITTGDVRPLSNSNPDN